MRKLHRHPWASLFLRTSSLLSFCWGSPISLLRGADFPVARFSQIPNQAFQEFKLEVKKKCADAAQTFLDSCVKLHVWTNKVEDVVADVISFKRDMISKKVGVNPGDVPVLSLLNWAAPCALTQEIQDKQTTVVTWCLHENVSNCTAVILPVFTYNRGKLHLEEIKALQALASGGHNLDYPFSMVFSGQCDPRDLRPMVYGGRLAFPAAATDLQKNPFFSSSLRADRRTKEVQQLPGKKMKVVEDGWGMPKSSCWLQTHFQA